MALSLICVRSKPDRRIVLGSTSEYITCRRYKNADRNFPSVFLYVSISSNLRRKCAVINNSRIRMKGMHRWTVRVIPFFIQSYCRLLGPAKHKRISWELNSKLTDRCEGKKPSFYGIFLPRNSAIDNIPFFQPKSVFNLTQYWIHTKHWLQESRFNASCWCVWCSLFRQYKCFRCHRTTKHCVECIQTFGKINNSKSAISLSAGRCK